jgi:hypothetical protein
MSTAIVVSSQKPKGKKVSAPTIVVNQPVKQAGKKKKKPNSSRNNNCGLDESAARYIRHITCADLTGPFRQPRFGSTARTGVGFTKAAIVITGNATNTVQAVQLQGQTYGGIAGKSFAVALESIALGAGSNLAWNVTYPPAAVVADVNVTAVDMVISYLGPPFSVAGELLAGACIPFDTTTTFGTMYFYPNSVRIPISKLVDNPIRIFGKKLSEDANGFVPTSSFSPDMDWPYLITSGLPDGLKLRVDITSTWEYRSTTASTGVTGIQDEGVDSEGSMHAFERYQAALDYLGRLVSPVLDAIPNFVEGVAGEAQRQLPHLARAAGQQSLMHLMANANMSGFRRTNSPRLRLTW